MPGGIEDASGALGTVLIPANQVDSRRRARNGPLRAYLSELLVSAVLKTQFEMTIHSRPFSIFERNRGRLDLGVSVLLGVVHVFTRPEGWIQLARVRTRTNIQSP